VTSEFYSTDILDKEEFWNLNLMKVGKDFLFGCATGFYSSWLETAGKTPPPPPRERQGITENHAYSIMEAVEHVVDGKTYRLVKLRYLLFRSYASFLTLSPEIHGVERNGTANGAMDRRNGPPSGCSCLNTNLAMME
jgi:hypothetical protein